MLFADSIFIAFDGAIAQLVPVGPPNKLEDVVSHPSATVLVCRPCLEAGELNGDSLDKRTL